MSEARQTVDYKGTDRQRLDVFLVSEFPDHSRSYLQSLIKKGLVSVDGEPILKTGHKLDQHAKIEIEFPPPEPSKLQPEAIPLEIVYEDENFIIVNKAAGMVVHPSPGHSSGTLVHAILAHCPDIEGVGGVKRPGLVHRLDRDTTGVIVLAKNDLTHRYLQGLFKKRDIRKTYLTLVDGAPPTKTGRIEAHIGRDPGNRQRMSIVTENKGRLGISEYKVLESFTHHSLIQVNILTGRTHQIRLHMAFLNCPVVGDRIYGHNKPTLPVNRQLLHAYQLEFSPPGSTSRQTFTAQIPQDFRQALKDLNYRGEL
jgi:23S rRNA pseudouridine1911/1915/1917 synthase